FGAVDGGVALEAPYPPGICDVFRDAIGDPFSPVALPTVERSVHPVAADGAADGFGFALETRRFCPWLTPLVVRLSEHVYQQRAWDELPVLCDALFDAGMPEDNPLMRHLRGYVACPLCAFATGQGDAPIWCGQCRDGRGWVLPEEPVKHYRGCWAIDALTGRS